VSLFEEKDRACVSPHPPTVCLADNQSINQPTQPLKTTTQASTNLINQSINQSINQPTNKTTLHHHITSIPPKKSTKQTTKTPPPLSPYQADVWPSLTTNRPTKTPTPQAVNRHLNNPKHQHPNTRSIIINH